jgi:hypothetical protein
VDRSKLVTAALGAIVGALVTCAVFLAVWPHNPAPATLDPVQPYTYVACHSGAAGAPRVRAVLLSRT